MRFCVALCAILGMVLMSGDTKAQTPIKDFAWSHRPLLIFAPGSDQNGQDPLIVQLEKIAQNRDGVLERDMVILTIQPGSVSVIAGDDSARQSSLTSSQLLYETYDVRDDAFVVILVGKDGTEKNRWSEPVDMRLIFDQIDVMPMRQREMNTP